MKNIQIHSRSVYDFLNFVNFVQLSSVAEERHNALQYCETASTTQKLY